MEVLLRFLFSGSFLGDFFKNLFLISGIHKIWAYHKLNEQRKYPTQEMKNAQSYFSTNSTRINAVCAILSDEKSKQTYMKIIKLRQFSDVNDIPEFSYYDQYFPKDIIKLTSNEVFVDCGAFNGDTIGAFCKRVKTYNKIVAFEPDSKNATRLEKKIIKKKNIIVMRCGVFDKNTQLFFTSDGIGSTINNQQSTINNQQSTINNQQSTINNICMYA